MFEVGYNNRVFNMKTISLVSTILSPFLRMHTRDVPTELAITKVDIVMRFGSYCLIR